MGTLYATPGPNKESQTKKSYIKLKERQGPATQGALELSEVRQAIWNELFEYTQVPYGLSCTAMDLYRNSTTTVDSTPATRPRLEMTEPAAALVRADADKAQVVATTRKRKRVNDRQGSGEDDNNNHVLYFLMGVAGSQFDDIWISGRKNLAKIHPKQPNEIKVQKSQSSGSKKNENGDEDDDEEENWTKATNLRCCTITLKQVNSSGDTSMSRQLAWDTPWYAQTNSGRARSVRTV
jgi:hypothetical protein